MRIVFLGTPDFAVGSLKALYDAGFSISAVVTAPDRPAGRGQKVQVSAVKELARQLSIPVLQPANLKDASFLSELRDFRADLQIVVAFRMLPEAVWNMPPLGTYNLHASLLPAYRGAAPINRAIMNGATRTGVTVFKLKHEVDTGNILLQAACPIGADITAGELHDELRDLGAELLVRAVRIIAESNTAGVALRFTEQDNESATHAPKIYRDDCLIDWKEGAAVIHNQVRGLSPYPGAFTYILKEDEQPLQLKILRSGINKEQGHGSNGSLYTDNVSSLRVQCGASMLDLFEVQLQGKRRMSTADFLRGFRFSPTDRFGNPG